MKYILFFLSVLIALFMFNQWMLEVNSTRLLELQLQEKKIKIDNILRCQELSATTTNENWGYKSCLEEINRVVTQTKLL